MRIPPTAGLLLVLATKGVAAQRADTLPYRDARLPVASRVSDLLARMTREEKFWQLFMIPGDLDDPRNDYSHGIFGLQIRIPNDTAPGAAGRHAAKINATQRYFVEKTRLGIPIIPFEEALHGLGASDATVFPQAIGLAATWDTLLMQRVATVIGTESRSRGVRDVLSPVINIASDVRWGRVEETYGEDPWLSARMARAFVATIEQLGVVTTPKHFIANVGDGGRDSYPIDLDERILDEEFFPPFKAAVTEAHARSIMSAYNSVNGVPASQNHWLLATKLKQEWGFRGFVISDAAATGGATVLHMTEANTATATVDALNAGLDVIFQSSYSQYRPYWSAFERGLIADSVIDAAVSRVLRAKFELGLFEHPYVSIDSAAKLNHAAFAVELARAAARESIVLLRNEHGALPISASSRSIAVIGADAVEARLGGYSGTGTARVSILDGIRDRAGPAATVRYAPGPGRVSPRYAAVPSIYLSPSRDSTQLRGLRGEYYDNNALAGNPRLVRTDAQVNFGWTLNSPGRGIPFDWYSVRWTGTFTAPPGLRHIGVEGNDGYRLYLDGKLLVDDWKKQSYGAHLAPVTLAPGSTHDIRLEFFESAGNARIKLVSDAGIADDFSARIADAVAAARASDIAVVVAGLEEGEFRDRSSLALPGHQEELIRAVAATGRPTVVVVVGGSAVTMSRWIDSVAAIVDAWYPGEQGGKAVADVLFGDYNPAGRLPITFPLAEGQLPLTYNHHPTGRGDDYLDLSGQPLFPFGFGLSYTSFDYSALAVDSVIAPNGTATVRFTVRNSGHTAGDEVAQLYIRDLLASTARPVMQLEGFTRLHLAPGESREVSMSLGPAQLQMLDQGGHWVVEPGTFRVMIGGSSKDIRLRGEVTVR